MDEKILISISPDKLTELMRIATAAALASHQHQSPQSEEWIKLSTARDLYDISIAELRRIIKQNQPHFEARAAKKLGDWRIRKSDAAKFILKENPL